MASKSGIHLEPADIPIVLGMIARGDRKHDIAAWFGVNQGRIAEAEDGKFGTPSMAPPNQLPPKGPPGLKGRRMREAVSTAIAHLNGGDSEAALAALQEAVQSYDANEV